MGCDIHGVWEVLLDNGIWYAIKCVNDDRSYAWFGILSGVRREGPKCGSYEWDPRDQEEEAGKYWFDYCSRWGADLHSHTLIQLSDVIEANEAIGFVHEPIPDLDSIVPELLMNGGNDEDDGPTTMQMNLPLREIMKLSPEAKIDDPEVASRLRMVVAYDN
jgi:hypothetical protein